MEASKNKGFITNALKRHVHYNFSVLEMVEESVEGSLINLEHFKRNYIESNSPSQNISPTKKENNILGAFKKIMKIPEKKEQEKEVSVLNVRKIAKIPLDMTKAVEQIISGTAFEKLMLLELDVQKIQALEPEEFRKKQLEIYRAEADKKSMEFMVEFNELVDLIGDNQSIMRDLNFFLIKEVSKVYVYLQMIMREYYTLDKTKEYLYAELITQNIQTALLRKDLNKATGGEYLIDPKELQRQIINYETKISSYESDNQHLRSIIFDVSERLKVEFYK